MHHKETADVFEEFDSSAKGLTSKEAKRRYGIYGPNKIKEEEGERPIKIFIRQFKSFIIYILIAATIVSLAIKEYVDASVIFAILILNSVLGFVQEYRAEKSIEALKKLMSQKAKVLRDGNEVEINAEDLVPGDIILLETGDKVPADARLIEISNLETQESSLTGESVPVKKELKVLDKETAVADKVNMVFSGTIVTAGRAKAVVVKTGMKTEIGKIAKLIQQEPEKSTPLQLKLKTLGEWLGILTIVICFLVVFGGILRGGGMAKWFMVGLSLAVAAIPEGLPAVVTISLALGVQRMVKKNALVRKLPSVETLGSTTVICADKTGTLTKNEMTVRKIYVNNRTIDVSGSGYDTKGLFTYKDKTVDPKGFSMLLRTGALCNNANLKNLIGDPTELGLIVSADKAGLGKEAMEKEYERIDEKEFTSERKLMSTLHILKNKRFVFSKGAPEVIVDKCDRILVNNEIKRFKRDDKTRILRMNKDFAQDALRVLGFAYKEADSLTEENLIFVGLQAMKDPPREEAKLAIEKCKKAGIKVVMVTGDYIETAVAVANELGLKGKAVTGLKLDKIKNLGNVVDDIVVYARVDPAHKIKIIDALKSKGHIVAMTGDGVNDAPALKKADIGVAMGLTGTDVAKEASDMILTDDNFASIVNAVEEGRGIYANIKKFLALLLSGNIGEVLIIFLAMLIGFTDPVTGILVLPLVAIQILWINLITDGLPALALGVDPVEPGVMERPPRHPKENIFQGLKAFIFGYPLVMLIGVMLIFTKVLSSDGVIKAQTMVFTSVIMFELFQAFSCRSLTKPSFKVGIFANKYLLGAVAISVLLHTAILHVDFLQNIFKVSMLGLFDWVIIIAVASTGFIYLEINKLLAMKKKAVGYKLQ